jgi:hypothetical protein
MSISTVAPADGLERIATPRRVSSASDRVRSRGVLRATSSDAIWEIAASLPPRKDAAEQLVRPRRGHRAAADPRPLGDRAAGRDGIHHALHLRPRESLRGDVPEGGHDVPVDALAIEVQGAVSLWFARPLPARPWRAASR